MDKTLCITHNQKRTLFCENCLQSLCVKCRDSHDPSHQIRFLEDTAEYINTKFKQGQVEIQRLRNKLQEALNIDPTTIQSESSVSALQHGFNTIDEIFKNIKRQLRKAKKELKEIFLEQFKLNYKNTVDQKSQKFLCYLDEVQQFIMAQLQSFSQLTAKKQHYTICKYRPKVDDLQQQLAKCDLSIIKMCEKATEIRPEFQILFSIDKFTFGLKDLLNRHIRIQYPGFEKGIYNIEYDYYDSPPPEEQVTKKDKKVDIITEMIQENEKKVEQVVTNFAMNGGMGEVITNFINNEYNFEKKDLVENVLESAKEMFAEEEKIQHPYSYLDKSEYHDYGFENHEDLLNFNENINIHYDIRNPTISSSEKDSKTFTNSIILDNRYELKSLKVSKDKFSIKNYDTMNNRGSLSYISIPDYLGNIALKQYQYVVISNCILLTGGYSNEDKCCSSDTIKINLNNQSVKKLKAKLRVPRMCHSMLYIDEQETALVVGGENDTGTMLDSCELLNFKNKKWKQISNLNYRGKNLSLVKFSKDTQYESSLFVYCFGLNYIEMLNLTYQHKMNEWIEIDINLKKNIPLNANMFQFDDTIVICGGFNDHNQTTSDVYFFDPERIALTKQSSYLQVGDKFIGGCQNQFVINRFENKIYFCSENFIHIAEYGQKLTVDNTLGVPQSNPNAIPNQSPNSGQKIDRSICPIHKNKKTLFCEECCQDLCVGCKDKHQAGHPIRFMEETSSFIISKFQDGGDVIATLRKQLQEAITKDPTVLQPGEENNNNALDYGNKMIDYIYEKIQQVVDQSRLELKERFKEAYKQNYRNTIEKKSQNFLMSLDKFQSYLDSVLSDFEKFKHKGKLVHICYQRPRVEEVQEQIGNFDIAFKKMVEKAAEFKDEYQIFFASATFGNEWKSLLNRYITIQYPGLESGVFQLDKPDNQAAMFVSSSDGLERNLSNNSNNSQKKIKNNTIDFSQPVDDDDSPDRQAEYDIRTAKHQSAKEVKSSPQMRTDQSHEIKTMKFSKDKFVVKIYDSQLNKGTSLDIVIPDQIRRIPTKAFGYVSLANEIIFAGGQYIEDKTCSIDTFKVNIINGNLKDMKSYMKSARMNHSMIHIEEKNMVLAVGGEDENNGLLNSCEVLNLNDNNWKMLNALNYSGKNLGLCKFRKDNNLFLYCFGRTSVERIDLNKNPIEPKWEELKIKYKEVMNLCANALQFDDNLIIISGGVDSNGLPSKDIMFYDASRSIMQKSEAVLGIGDKFLGGAQSQYIINRLETKLLLCSDTIIHQAEYGQRAGDAKLLFKATFY